MLTMRQLEAFRAVIETGSITKASERLGLSQPAVSKLIAGLERETGLQLFRRDRRRLLATPEAARIYEEAQRLFVGLSDVMRLAEELGALKSGVLTVASLSAIGRGHLPRILAEFLRAHPKVSMSLQVRSSNKVVQWAIAQQIDVGIAQTGIEHPEIGRASCRERVS
jgi:DNA-binding transcriptional LysR family regulator